MSQCPSESASRAAQTEIYDASMDDLDVAVDAAAAGATVVRAGFGETSGLTFKGRFNPVTATDEASERSVLGVIARHRPDDAVLAEESGGSGDSGRRWIVDPLDGTVNFVHGIPQIAVSVALYDGDVALAGVIHDPLRQEVFSAAAGRGAFLNGKPIRVSGAGSLESAVVATGFPYDHGAYADGYARTLGAVLGHVNGVRRFGSAALDLAWVACGRYEAYWELGIAPWDQAAGLLLVREAGGRVTDPSGNASIPATPMVVASNGTVHDELCAIVAAAMPDHLR